MDDKISTKKGFPSGNAFYKKRVLVLVVALVLFVFCTFFFINTFEPQVGQADEQVMTPNEVPLVTKIQPSEIAIVMAYDNKESHYLPRSKENKEEYANFHGYRFLQDTINDPTRGAAWGKILTLRKYMKMYPSIKWFWWIDVDTILMDFTIPLEDAVLANLTKPEYAEKDLIIAYDCNGFNAGSFLIRNTPWSQNFLSTVYSPKYQGRFGYAEQGTMQHLYETKPEVAEHFYFVPQKLINAFPGSCLDLEGFTEGDLLVHFAGCWVDGQENCVNLFNQYWARRIHVPLEH